MCIISPRFATLYIHRHFYCFALGTISVNAIKKKELKSLISFGVYPSFARLDDDAISFRVAFLSGFLPRFGQIGSRHVFEFSMPNRPRLLLQEFPPPPFRPLFFLFRYRRSEVCRSGYRETSVSKTSLTRDAHVCTSIRKIRLLILNVGIFYV